VIEVTEQNFDEEVLGCELPVFTCFTAKWCHSCYPTCLFAGQLVEKYGGKVKFARLDIEKNPRVVERYNIITVPTIILFQTSQVVKRLLGFQELSSLKASLNSVTDKNGASHQ